MKPMHSNASSPTSDAMPNMSIQMLGCGHEYLQSFGCLMFLDVFCVSCLAILGVKGWELHGIDAAKDVATHNESTLGACRKGYTDILCMDCAPKYFATGNQCEECHDTMTFSKSAPLIVAAITVILAVIGGGAWLLVRHNTHTEVQHGPSASGALKEQLKAQLPILLQLCHSVITG